MNQELKWIILVSILLNVLLVGILFGQLPRRMDRELTANKAWSKPSRNCQNPSGTVSAKTGAHARRGRAHSQSN